MIYINSVGPGLMTFRDCSGLILTAWSIWNCWTVGYWGTIAYPFQLCLPMVEIAALRQWTFPYRIDGEYSGQPQLPWSCDTLLHCCLEWTCRDIYNSQLVVPGLKITTTAEDPSPRDGVKSYTAVHAGPSSSRYSRVRNSCGRPGQDMDPKRW